jgi:hypothetical protein
MKVFISSLIAGFEPLRQAARNAVTTLRHEPVMAEDFGAGPNSPQIACLRGLRESELIILVLGDGYGPVQPSSGLSATHEEYREARGQKPVIAFVKEGAAFDAAQAAFVAEVQGWEGGLFRGTFRDASDLQAAVTRALHDYELANAVGPMNPDAMTEKATALVTRSDRDSYSAPVLYLSVVGGPAQAILRPAEMEATGLEDFLYREATLGENRFFERSKGSETSIDDSALLLAQERGGLVRLDEQGSVLLRVPLEGTAKRGGGYGSMPVIIEETVVHGIGIALGSASSILDHIDPTQRITHVAVAARIGGSNHLAWRTSAEHDASPGSITMGIGFSDQRPPTHLLRPRPALRLDRPRMIEDLVVPLKRQWK